MRTIPILIEERAGIPRAAEPVTVGLPFPKGYLSSTALLELRDADGRLLPLQAETVASWSDGSVKWALLDFQASMTPDSTTTYELVTADRERLNDDPGMVVEESAERIVVDTGTAKFVLDTRRFAPFRRVLVGGIEILREGESHTSLVDEQDRHYRPEIAHLEVETRGSCRTTVLARGCFRDSTDGPCAEFTGRLSFFRDTGIVEIRFTLRNANAAEHRGGFWDLGDPGSIYFKQLTIATFAAREAAHIKWLAEPEASPGAVAPGNLEIYQDSSGGDNWMSSNHMNRDGLVMNTFRGYRVVADGTVTYQGHRARPVVTVADSEKSVTVAVEDFWQNFPKAIEVKGGWVNLGLFPSQYRDVHELQSGEQKTHVVFMQFSAGSSEPASLRWVHDRLVPGTTPEWYAKTGAVPYLTPIGNPGIASRWLSAADAFVGTAVTGPDSFFARREIIDEYGWRHFGDLYADHEAIGYRRPGTLVAHYNNQYDVVRGAAIQYMRCGDRRWFDLMRDLARHVSDIDIYHTERDRPAFNGGLFWHTEHYKDAATCTHRGYSRLNVGNRNTRICGGGPSNEHNYTSGLLVYHYLTGDPVAKESVQSLAKWVTEMDEGRRRAGGWLDRRRTGFASVTAGRDYHGPGRGCGNSINALLDGYAATGEQRWLDKAEELIRRCIHPRDDIGLRQLEDVEHRWSYSVFLQTLGRYLDVKAEAGELDRMFCYARESLLHYARWMAAHEVPYKVVLDRVEIPTETWPAQDIRKANALAFAAKYAEEAEATLFAEKADFFFRTCVSDLLSFETARLTRPIVILMTNAYMQGSKEWRSGSTGRRHGPPVDFGEPRPFVPQFSWLHRLRAVMIVIGTRLAAARGRRANR